MSESSLLTRCPKCKTQFRVTAEQLSVANGKVRCGSCMSIFNALEHRTSSQPAPAPSAPQPAEQPETIIRLADEEEFVFADNPEEDATERGYKGSDSLFSADELSDSFLAMEEGSFTGFSAEDEDDANHRHPDESWAEAILDEDNGDTAAAPERPPAAEPEPQPAREAKPELDTKPALELEPLAEPSTKQPASPAASPEPQQRVSPPPADTESELSLQPEADDLPPPAATEPLAAATKAEPFHDLAQEPISVAGKGGGNWLKRTIWTLLVLVLIGALGAQVGYFQFDRLSTIPQLRPYYEMACDYAGCELAPLTDIDRIQSRKLVVRTDPDNRNALIVDAEIVNRAAFEQPFPAIALTFSNLNGDVVAQSVFPPARYLAGEGSDLAAMPKEVPVRIAIRIRDPGRDAVNYNITFRPYAP